MNIEKSESLDKLATSLCMFQNACPKIDLDATVKVATKTGGSYTFDYATLPHIIETIKPHLKECGLSYSQLINGGGVFTMLMHNSGQYIASYTNFESKVDSLQDFGGKITYLKRYALTAILGIAADDDDDGNSASGNKAERSEKQKSQEQPKPWLNKGTDEYKKIYLLFLAGNEKATVTNVRSKWAVNNDVANALELALKVGRAISENKTTIATVQKDFGIDTKDINHVIEYINGSNSAQN